MDFISYVLIMDNLANELLLGEHYAETLEFKQIIGYVGCPGQSYVGYWG